MWKRVAGDKPPAHGQVLDLLLFSAACHRDSKVGHIACDHPEFTEYLRCEDNSIFRFAFTTFHARVRLGVRRPGRHLVQAVSQAAWGLSLVLRGAFEITPPVSSTLCCNHVLIAYFISH